MKTLVGIFTSQVAAATAYQELRALGIRGEGLIVLTPGASLQQLEGVPTEDGEQPGMGQAIGGVIGAAFGLAAGAAVANLLLPGVGPVIAIGLTAGPLGLSGAAVGAVSGGAFEKLLTRGLPKDELFFYEDALRQGRTVIIIVSEDNDLLAQSRQIMENNGAESLDAAREKWWIGLRDSEKTEYGAPNNNHDQQLYRLGFEAALDPDLRGKAYEDATGTLAQRFPRVFKEDAFQRGYQRAQDYYLGLQKKQ